MTAANGILGKRSCETALKEEGESKKKHKVDPKGIEAVTAAAGVRSLAGLEILEKAKAFNEICSRVDFVIRQFPLPLPSLIFSYLDIGDVHKIREECRSTRASIASDTDEVLEFVPTPIFATDTFFSSLLSSNLPDKRMLCLSVIRENREKEISLDTILSALGNNVEILDLEHADYFGNDFAIKQAVEIVVEILQGAAKHCPNLKSLKLPTDTLYGSHFSTQEIIVKAVSDGIKTWSSLDSLSLDIFYLDILKYIPVNRIKNLTLEFCHIKKDQLKLIAEKCKRLESFQVNFYMGEDSGLLTALADNCPNLNKLVITGCDSVSADDYPFIEEGLCKIIEKCPLRSLYLKAIYFRFSLINALLKHERQLEEVTLLIPNCIEDDDDPPITNELLSKFFKVNHTLRSLHVEENFCDRWYSALLEFASENKNLKHLQISFGKVTSNSFQITSDQVRHFAAQCSHIEKVTLDLVFFNGLKRSDVNYIKNNHKNITLIRGDNEWIYAGTERRERTEAS